MDNRSIDLYVKILLETDEISLRMKEFGINERTWHESRALRDLVLLPLIQIGELTTHFKDACHLSEFPGIPWRDIKGFRNIVVYGYGQIDVDIAWASATEGVREIREALLADESILARYNAEKDFAVRQAESQNLAELIDALPSDK